MKLFTKIIKFIFITAICAVLLWGLAYLISPTVKDWSNEHIFQIEQPVEDETPEDEENEDETGDNENEGDVNGDGTTEDEVLEPNTGDKPLDEEGTETTEE